MTNLTRVTRKEIIGELPDFDGDSIVNAEAKLSQLRLTVPPDAKIVWMQREFSDNYYYAIVTYRPETDAEFEKRQKVAAQIEVRERAELARLKAKYEPSSTDV